MVAPVNTHINVNYKQTKNDSVFEKFLQPIEYHLGELLTHISLFETRSKG